MPKRTPERWSFLKPSDYPDYLFDSGMMRCAADPPCIDRDPILLEFMRLSDMGRRYKPALSQLTQRFATPYVLAARGLHDIRKIDDMRSLASPPDGDDMSVSMNVFASASLFSTVGREDGDAVLMIFKLPPDKLSELGGDSESGALFEAELKAYACWDCVDRMYVMSKRALAGKAVGADERAEYGLSAFLQVGRWGIGKHTGKSREIKAAKRADVYEYLHTALPLNRLADVKRLGLDYKITKSPPDGWRWFRVL